MAKNNANDPIIYGVYTNIGEYCLYVGTSQSVAKYLGCTLNSFYSKVTEYKKGYYAYKRDSIHVVRVGRESEL